MDHSTVTRHPGIRQPAHVIRHVQKAVEHIRLQLRVKQADKGIGVAHTVPNGVIVGEIADVGAPIGVFLGSQIGGTPHQAGKHRIENAGVQLTAALHIDLLKCVFPHLAGTLIYLVKGLVPGLGFHIIPGIGHADIGHTHPQADGAGAAEV